MAKICPLCGKTGKMGGKRNLLRGKYNPTKTKRKQPNLQWARLANGRRAKICTDCLKKLYQ
jgi:ribosomal protein L28